MAVKSVTNAPQAQQHVEGAQASQARLETRLLAVDGGQIAYDDTGGSGPLL